MAIQRVSNCLLLNVINPPFVNHEGIIVPSPHLNFIKLGIIKQVVKALHKDGKCSDYLSKNIAGLSKGKLKAGIYDRAQTRELVIDDLHI